VVKKDRADGVGKERALLHHSGIRRNGGTFTLEQRLGKVKGKSLNSKKGGEIRCQGLVPTEVVARRLGSSSERQGSRNEKKGLAT